MLQSRVGCTCSTGSTPMGPLLRTELAESECSRDVLDARHVLSDVAEVQLHPDEIGERDPVDDDLRRMDDAPVTEVPLEPEEDVVSAPRAVVAVVAKRQPHARGMLASDHVCALDRGGRLLELPGDLADG